MSNGNSLSDSCGACCRTVPVYVMEEDALREPRIAREALRNTNQQCDIYATRPVICRELAAGSEQCQGARLRQGLQRLKPRNELRHVDTALHRQADLR